MRTLAIVVLGLGMGLLEMSAQGQTYREPGTLNGVEVCYGGRRSSKPKQKPQQKQPKVESVTIDGTIEALGRGEMKVVNTKDKKHWVVAPQSNTKLYVKGTANADYLRPKLTIQFKAVLGDQDTVKDKLSDLSVVTPSKINKLGIFADGVGGDAGIGDPLAPGKSSKAKPAAAPLADGDLLSTGQKVRIVAAISTCDGNKLTLSVGSRTIKAELADNPTIDVSSSDPRQIQVGSKVVIHGKGIRGTTNLCQADDVKVTLTQPLVGKKKPLSAGKTPDKSADDADEPSPFTKDAKDGDSKDSDPADDKAADDKAADAKDAK